MKNDDYYDKCDDSHRNKHECPQLSQFSDVELKMELKRRENLHIEMKIAKLTIQIEELKKQLGN